MCVCEDFKRKKKAFMQHFMQRIKYVYRPYATQLSHDIITFGLMMSLTYVSSIPILLPIIPDYVLCMI